MHFSTLLWTTSATVATVSASYAITGTQTGIVPQKNSPPQRPFRMEINNFVNTGPAFDLYIQALLNWQAHQYTPGGDLKQYFNIAGIHGYPQNTPWDGVSRTSAQSGGFCTHGSVLFPTWHRPYLAAFETQITSEAAIIAANYSSSNRAVYQAAAATMRIPYWDWSVNYELPPVVNSPYIEITTNTGPQAIVNPLFQFNFPPPSLFKKPVFPSDAISKVKTVRTPDSNGNSQPGVINQNLLANKQMVHDAIYPILSSQPSYNAMSNTNYKGPNGQTYQNFENMHNYIHGQVGGYLGHMSYIVYAAYDPIFWLHHANVDRLFAMWQALYPTSWISQEVSQSGVTENENTALAPFHSDGNNHFHTSDTVRSTSTFGYTYPELVDWNITPAALAAKVRATVNSIYNPSSSSKSKRDQQDDCGNTAYTASPALPSMGSAPSIPSGLPVISPVAGSPAVYTPAPVAVVPASPAANSASYQWVVNIVADKTKIPASCFVHFYFNAPRGNASDWSYDPNLIATHSVLIPPSDVPSGATTSAGQVPLTYALLTSNPDIGPAAYDHVKSKLQYRAQRFDNSVILPGDLSKAGAFTVEICSRSVTQQGADEFPIYGDWETHYTGTLGNNGYSVAA